MPTVFYDKKIKYAVNLRLLLTYKIDLEMRRSYSLSEMKKTITLLLYAIKE